MISTSFADIFHSNALKNGLLPVTVDPGAHRRLFQVVEADRGAQVNIDLVSQTLTLPGGKNVEFPVDPFSKYCLLEGLDQLGYLLKHEEQITAYEQSHGKVSQW